MSADQGERQLFAVAFEAIGVKTDRVKSYKIESNYTTSTDGFSFTIADFDRDTVDGLELQPVELFIDGHSQLLGRIEVTERRDDSTVVCSGRDYLSDLVTCSADPTLKVKEEQSLEDALKLACGPIGVTEVVDEADAGMREIRSGFRIKGKKSSSSRRKNKLEDWKVHPNETIWDFCNRLAARQGVTIQCADHRGAVMLSEPDYMQESAYTLVRKLKQAPGERNTILSATARRDLSTFPTHLLVVGKSGASGTPKEPTVAEVKWPGLANAVKESAAQVNADVASATAWVKRISLATLAAASIKIEAQDSGNSEESVHEFDVRLSSKFDLVHAGRIKPTDPPKTGYKLYRLLYHRDTDSKSKAQLDKVCLRLMSERLKNTLHYEVVVRGHCDPVTGAFYTPNTMITVADEITGVNERLWIEGRAFEQVENGAARTTLVCWRPYTFIV
jgi:prophage tail gpP-like protein